MNGDKGVRKPKQGEKDEGVGLTYEVQNVRSPHSPPLWRLFLLKYVNQADDRDLAWLVELLESVLASAMKGFDCNPVVM